MEAFQSKSADDEASWRVSSGEQGVRSPSISLVIPAYNEQETIEQAICEADDALAALTKDYEILVIDDGSKDETSAIAEQLSHSRRAVRVLRQPRNMGYGAALSRGFQAARKDLVAFTDGDCQFDVRELDRLVLLCETTKSFVVIV